MRYTNEEIRTTLYDFISETGQYELRYVIPFCIGYYGYVSKQIWTVIHKLIQEGYIK